MTRDRYKITAANLPHFLTCSVVNWLPIFTRPEAAEKALKSLRHLQQTGQLTIYGYVLLENHLHLIAAAHDLSAVIRRFKSYTARSIIDLLQERQERGILQQLSDSRLSHKRDREYQFWQEGVHPILVQDDNMMRQKLDYVHANPVRRGYVDDATHWRYSSARNYAGRPGILEVTMDW